MFFSWSRTRLRLVLDHEKTFYNLHLFRKYFMGKMVLGIFLYFM